MAKLKCHCGEVLSNVKSSNKVEFDCESLDGESLINVWVCTCGDFVNVNGKWFKRFEVEKE